MLKDKVIRVRIEADDKKLIEEYCNNLGLNVSNFVRYCVLQKIKELNK